MKQFMDENFLLETETAQELFHNHAAKRIILFLSVSLEQEKPQSLKVLLKELCVVTYQRI